MIVKDVISVMYVSSEVRICTEEGETLYQGGILETPRYFLNSVVEGVTAVGSIVELEV